MTAIDPAFERKILRDVIEQTSNPEETERKQRNLRRMVYGVGYAGLLVAFFLGLNGVGSPFSAVLIAAFSGIAIGFVLFLQFAQRQWPVTRQYIDLDRIRKRLEELE